MGLVMYYEDRKEIIPYIKDTSNLEYMITSSFKKLVNPERKKIAVLKSFGAQNLSEDTQLKSLVRKQYDVVDVTTSTKKMSDYSALLIISPQEKLSAADLEWLKDKISRLPTAIFIDRLNVPTDTFYA